MLNNTEASLPEASWPKAFWRTLKRIDKNKRNSVSMSLRNAVAVALPLGVGIAIGNPLGAVAVATGALNVAYSDGIDPYSHRARRMLAWSFLGAFAVFLGSVTGNYHLLAMIVASAWAFVAGLLVSIGTRPGDLGLNSLVTLIVYPARGAMSPKGAFYAGLLVLGGGLLQTALALLSWPIQRYGPERRAIAKVYLDLAAQAAKHPDDVLAAPLKQASGEVQDTLSALGRDHSLGGERFRLLFDQADRLRFSIYGVSRLRAGPEHEARTEKAIAAETPAEQLDHILELACNLLRGVGESLLSDQQSPAQPDLLRQLQSLTHAAQKGKNVPGTSYAPEFAAATDVLAGQLRVVAQLADSTTEAGAEEFANYEFAPPLKLQLRNWLATLKANLHFRSPAFRHGVRLAVCIAIAEEVGLRINTQRNYWLAMTVAVVLKPDFTTTISRGVLRLAGTFGGLLLATALYHSLPHSALTQLALVGVFTFFLRSIGPANYGIFSVTISGLIVFLIATTGVSPAEVLGERAINTAAGGLFALVAYALWPTWERSQVSDVLAEMIDRMRDYFRVVATAFEAQYENVEARLDETRDEWRKARSNAEASVDRFSSEPGVDPEKLDALTSILASSHAFARMTMGLEAGLAQKTIRTVPPEFEGFAHDVDFTLYFLSAALRGSHAASETLPQLREDHRRLAEAYERNQITDDYVLVETDRLTVSLNTLREQVIRYVSSGKSAAPEPVHTRVK